MDQLRNYADQRNTGFCVHCGGPPQTRDHAPSKVFLDPPYPENLPVHDSCARCNEGFSADEEYLACLLECVLAGSTRPEEIERARIRRVLEGAPALAERIEKAKQIEKDGADERLIWRPELERVSKVVLKLARCHAAYELNEPQTGEPDFCEVTPLPLMTAEQRDTFENATGNGELAAWPEVGSRAMQRIRVMEDAAFQESWIEVQERRYRYMVATTDGTLVRGVIREYLAFEVMWYD